MEDVEEHNRKGRKNQIMENNASNFPQSSHMQTLPPDCNVYRDENLMLKNPMEMNREPEPPDETTWMDEGVMVAADATNLEKTYILSTIVGENLMEEEEVEGREVGHMTRT
ncbi:hypothetical protein OIU79_023917 [Salix purpurea]|uniref:Uncharacterized protein n=1 Tax=Salix purpurea TaxID=77065 RepID=A0A9Q0WA74_SALPP|nr:hypothetical protein OIU79_023917 [Salix purpurea]